MNKDRLAELGQSFGATMEDMVRNRRQTAVVAAVIATLISAGTVLAEGKTPAFQCPDGVTIFGGQQLATYTQLGIRCEALPPSK